MPRKPDPLYQIYSLVIADHHMSGRLSFVTLKCKKHVITVLRYMSGSVYVHLIKIVFCLLLSYLKFAYLCFYLFFTLNSPLHMVEALCKCNECCKNVLQIP